MASELSNQKKAWSVLIVSTLAFTVCFMVWMMFGVIGIPIKKMLNLNATEFGLLTAMPVLTGSLIRVPLGIWTDKYGGRIVMACVMAISRPNSVAFRPRVFFSGMPTTANIIHTMKHTVKASVVTISVDQAWR